MAEDTQNIGHPLDQQNAIERAIQLEGPKDPDNFKMPDGRTLTEVRKANQESEEAEYQKELQMISRTTRESSIAEFQKGEKTIMTKAGNIIDVTDPKKSEDEMTMAESRTSLAQIEEGAISSPKERAVSDSSTRGSVETSTSFGQSTTSSVASNLPGSISPSSSSNS